MAYSASLIFSPLLDALWRLARFLFGRSERVVDAEGGTLDPFVIVKDKPEPIDPVETFQPKLEGVPALILSTMALGGLIAPTVSGPLPTVAVAGGPPVPRIIVTPPVEEMAVALVPVQTHDRIPLAPMSNNVKRVHGRRSKARASVKVEKENVQTHPQAPRPTVSPPPAAPVASKVSQADVKVIMDSGKPSEDLKPGSSAWQADKAQRLAEAREFSDKLKARHRRSLPTPAPSPSAVLKPLVRSASAPARISLEERLRRAVVNANTVLPATGPVKPTRPLVPAPPLWGDGHVLYILDDGEEEEEEGGASERRNSTHSTWSDVFSLDDYA
ncbi:hypothetical protein C8R46DRAFT_1034210 [Mycena filopes]|nr:hypothetical protein C8R46DRAFT_1034210 [Mycena filopes]